MLIFPSSSSSSLFSVSGYKLRRQHWCLLILLLILLFFFFVFFFGDAASSLNSASDNLMNSPKLQQEAVTKLLKEVPLIDG